MPSFSVRTLGCKLNQLESEAISSAFLQAGFTLLKNENETSPSVIVINTCTVTSKADQKARRVIRKALRDYPDSCVLVTGCYAQLDTDKLRALEPGEKNRLFVLKGLEKESILELPQYLREGEDVFAAVKNLELGTQTGARGTFRFSPESFSGHTRAFLKIQDGCGKNCSYCRIRLARGPSVSLDADRVLERLRILEKSHGEAVLTGVNICQYCDEKIASNLAALLEHLLCGTEKIALRLSSLAPENIDENLANVLSHKRIRPHFHLSIQSGSKKILEKMGRSYDGETAENAAALLRRAKADPFLACDIITGFPGEGEAEFEETYRLCKKIKFAWIHVFPYSKRPGTPAFSFPRTVPESEVTKRVKLLTSLAREGRAEYARRWLGREVEALIEAGNKAGSFCRAVSENYLKLLVRFPGDIVPLAGTIPPAGTILRCKLVEKDSFADAREDYDAAALCV